MSAIAAADAARGLPVFPVYEPGTNRSGCSCNDLHRQCTSPAKHPRTPNGFKDASTDAATVAAWWRHWPNANVAIATGSGWFVLDVDQKNGGNESLADLTRQHGALPETVTALTGGGGAHYWFRTPEGETVTNSTSAVARGIDIRGDGGYVVAPGSTHVTGNRYEWAVDGHPDDVAVALAPDWLMRLIREKRKPAHRGRFDADSETILEGTRDNTLTSLAGTMRRRRMTQSEIAAALHAVNAGRCVPPLPDTRVEEIAASAARYAPGDLIEDTDIDSWAFQDVRRLLSRTGEPAPELLRIGGTGAALLYSGRVNALWGESEGGKSWIALVACAEVLKAGGAVAYLDFEADGTQIAHRLRCLGVDEEALVERLLYARPSDKLTEAQWERISSAIVSRAVAIVVVDGITDAMTNEGLEPLSNRDYAEFHRRVPRRLADLGPAVLLVDHVVKAAESRGQYAIGAQHKRAAITGASFIVKALTPFGIGKTSRIALEVAKDKAGHVNALIASGKTVAFVTLSSDAETEAITFEIEAATDSRDDAGNFRPTHLMERASRFIEENPGSGVRDLMASVGGRGVFVSKAVTQLVREGYVRRESGSRGKHLHTSIRSFRESEDADRMTAFRPVPTVSLETVNRVFPVSPASMEAGSGNGHTPMETPQMVAPRETVICVAEGCYTTVGGAGQKCPACAAAATPVTKVRVRV